VKKKVLLWINPQKNLDHQILIPTNYQSLEENYYKGNNVGNKLFCRAIERFLYLSSEQKMIDYHFFSDDLTIEQINNEYDIIVSPQANLLGPYTLWLVESLTDFIRKIKIPILMIGVGTQASRYEDIHELYNYIKKPACKFLKAVYDTGGDFALRGYFTYELFQKLGYKNATVTGCPSMYQMGRNITISNDKVNDEKFKPILNGHIRNLMNPFFSSLFKHYPQSIYLDQDQFMQILYLEKLEKNKLADTDIKNIIKTYSISGFNLLCQNRVKLFYDVPVWFNYIRNNGFNFSFGSRIHGNIASLLNGIPAVVYAEDSRTRELAEFFDIPFIQKISIKKDLYDIYHEANYTAFNKGFISKYDNFLKFLYIHGLQIPEEGDCDKFKVLEQTIHYSDPVILYEEFIYELARMKNNQNLKKLKIREKCILLLLNIYNITLTLRMQVFVKKVARKILEVLKCIK
jgi:hypothetical protein